VISDSDATDRIAEPAPDLARCLTAVEGATAIVRERWKPAILWLIASGHRRFSELQRALPNATHKMLSQQLQDLVRDGILTRWSAERGRRHVEYSLTPAGEALRPLLEELEIWGRKHAPRARQDGSTRSRVDEARPIAPVREIRTPIANDLGRHQDRYVRLRDPDSR
jgi:DNA-binding HxlR family transcriptional regulator